MRRAPFAWLIAAALIVTASAPAAAPPGASPAAVDESAPWEDLINQARAAFDRRMFARSAALLREAYELRKEPLILYNVGRSYQEAGMAPEALAAFAEFLLTEPRGDDKALAESRVREALGAKGKPPLPACAGVTCPVIEGYAARCNPSGACELTSDVTDTPWQALDAWIYLPGGWYTLAGGSKTARGVLLKGLLVAKHEITVGAYDACVAAGKCTPASAADWTGSQGVNRSADGRQTHPQNGLQWQQARDACAFVGGRLLSEAEWEATAAGPTPRTYPWGDSPAPGCANGTAIYSEAGGNDGWGCKRGGTAPVGTAARGASNFGAMDMAGNVWEWVEDCWHTSLDGAPTDGSAWTDACEGGKRAIRGGSYYSDDPADLRTTRRDPHIPATRRAHIGARCAIDLHTQS